MLRSLKERTEGFTIIEVMIVLAIAALILVVVLIAVPQLQKNQRNSARRDIAGRIKAELDTYAGNNNGNYPAANTASLATNLGQPSAALGFFDRYFDCDSTATPPTCAVNIDDPKTGTPLAGVTPGVGNDAVVAPSTTAGSIAYVTKANCNGEVSVANGQSRQYALLMRLEGGAVFCLDNH